LKATIQAMLLAAVREKFSSDPDAAPAVQFVVQQSVGGDKALEFHHRLVEAHLAAVDIGNAAAGLDD
jgi:hypothetical protein